MARKPKKKLVTQRIEVDPPDEEREDVAEGILTKEEADDILGTEDAEGAENAEDAEDILDPSTSSSPSSTPPSSPSTSPPPPLKRYEPLPSPPKDDKASDKPLRIYADGIYDLFHFGHARSLEQAKKSLKESGLPVQFSTADKLLYIHNSSCQAFPNVYLLVGCCSDALTNKHKGKTVMNENERYESLRHCRWVDEVIEDAPWVITMEFLDKHQIDYVAHDALPYADTSGAGKDVYEFVKAAGKFKETKRTDGVSTSDLIMRIVKDYNEYVMRNLARGYTRKDLGVSYVKEKQLQVGMGITKLRQKVKEQQERVGQKLGTVASAADLTEWVENADRWVSGFLEKFEEGCHVMESAIKTQIQKGLLRQQMQLKARSDMLLTNGDSKLLGKTTEGSSSVKRGVANRHSLSSLF